MWCARLPHRRVLAVTGADAARFLNGIISASIPASPAPFYTAFIHAQGRVLNDAFVYPRPGGDGFLVEYDGRESAAPPLAPLLKRFVLRSKVKLTPLDDELSVWAVWGRDEPELPRKWRWARSGSVEPVWPHDALPWSAGRDNALVDRRAPGMGLRMLVRQGDQPEEAASHDVVDAEQHKLHRILNGVPEGVEEIVPLSAFPMESNLDVMGAVDFRKGCYVGQELTVRTYHTGVIRKRILPVQLYSPDSTPSPELITNPEIPMQASGLDIRLSVPPSAELLSDEPAPRPRSTGKLLASTQGVGLALLRLEHLDAVLRGELRLAVGEDGWGVQPWWPSWFPRRGVDEVDEDQQ